MNNKTKSIILAIATLLALLCGIYFSGLLTLLFVKQPTGGLHLSTFFDYLREHGGHPIYGKKIKVSGMIGFGLPLLGVLFVAVKLWQQKKDLYGSARFATLADLKKAKFLESSNNAIVVGRMDNKYLYFSGQQFCLLAAPTRSGKGVGIVIPNLLSYQGSMVVLDIKQENFELTSGFRAKYGQEIYLFNPFAEDMRTHRWNPLTYISSDPKFRVSDLMSIAAMLYPMGEGSNGNERFWMSQAQNVFMAFALYLLDQRAWLRSTGTQEEVLPPCTMGALYRLSAGGNGGDLKEFFQGLSQKNFVSEACKTAFSGLLSQAEETFSNIMASFKEPLNAWINPVLDAATSADDFLLTDVRRRKMTIYIGIQPNKLAESRLIVNLFFSQLINQNTKELPQNNPELKHQCLLLMDEFTSIGKVEIIAKSVSYMAGYNIRLLPIIQSLAQLDAVYGREASRTLVTNHALQILYTPREQQDANDYSEMLGYTTVKKQTRTHGEQSSTSESEEQRRLMLPQELKAMSADQEIFIYEGLDHPVMCEKIRYYKEAAFTERLLPKVDVPRVHLD